MPTVHPKILITGDSFAADWSIKYQEYPGWPNLLAQRYNVTNLAQAGCSEYKIYQQLAKENLNNYDCVIISHTSPYRIPVEVHPTLSNDILHKNADLIYSDIKDKNLPELTGIIDFFENYFDTEYAGFVHELIIKKQTEYLGPTPTLHMSYYSFDMLETLQDNLCFESIYSKNKGLINHMSQQGNQQLAEIVNGWIKKVVQ